jgi:glucose-1-phosphate adenylyltransferase
MKEVLAFIMAGGKGKRLLPLTLDRAKPAVPFGGIYRLIDFTLSNCINSQIYKIIVLPQYKSQSLSEHLEFGWDIFSRKMGHFLKVVPPQQRRGDDWYQGTADSIRQNMNLIKRYEPAYVLVLSGDHIYKMDFRRFIQYHEDNKADITISLLEVRKEQAHQFGISEVDNDFRIVGFQEKPKENPKTIPGDPQHVLASMGIYLFRTEILLNSLESSERDDFGHGIIPRLLGSCRMVGYPYRRQNTIEDYIFVTSPDGKRERKLEPRIRDSSYWRDVGALDAYWNANMDLTGVDPHFNLYGRKWSIHSDRATMPPAKFIFANENPDNMRVGKALDSLVSSGCLISGIVRNSVLSNNVVVRSWAKVAESVIMGDVVVGRHSRVKKAIVDKENDIPQNTDIGYNPTEDRKKFKVTPRGIVVVPKGYFQKAG